MHGRLLVYGATGYTGQLVARRAVETGLDVVVAGRDPRRVTELAAELGVEARTFEASDARDALEDIDCVLNVAGPFRHTARPLLEACLAAGAHYLDTTAEFDTFTLAESLDSRATQAGVMLMSGTGWDVVPSDCLALHTARRTAEPEKLTIALRVTGGFSRGSLASSAGIEDLGILVRRSGELVRLETTAPRTFDFGNGPEKCVPVPMGDLITAPHSTGLGDVEVYLGTDDGFPATTGDGPTAEERAQGRYFALAEVTGHDGRVARSLVTTPTGYTFTQHSSVEIARRVLDGRFTAGYQTPASAYGPELATAIAGTTFTDL
ncbi:saccharopine dehydrogenase NADP-binding domain-containing protein [Amycolatopsis mongoliensis]|uniref:Saccharopine dehydrogenase NADP-binding domain-containing protein n=1 Tax=Amycolatopsis mongoliensis TaxID=715475 RepID=A0A9Y2NHJ4_9PSEU|nr:saccharopine dehydrogenase NADP-binding domain-containing protein [Amycolatopsis sp. 4-36]WIX98259.1 saccharopine dehydrogenase NADP-binding domain-containing protein [Amycolatopsis sp. 4-36]